MIHVKRNPATPSLDVYDKNNTTAPDGNKKPKAVAETEKMINFFGDTSNFDNDQKLTDKDNPKFSAYKNKPLVDLLTETFHEKCAYCESKFMATSNEDVEHFRPKGRIETENGKVLPGYYWLGADWNNLLISCQLCNRRQNHNTPDGDDETLLGKADLFPLSDETKRVRRHNQSVDAEESVRLLINPCIESRPDNFFEFDENGTIRSKTASGKKHDMAIASIETYALQRMPLVGERAKAFKEVKRQFRRVRDRIKDFNEAMSEGDQDDIDDAQEEMDFEMMALRDLFHRKSPYLAMKRKLLKQGLDADDFGDITSAGVDLELLLKDFEPS